MDSKPSAATRRRMECLAAWVPGDSRLADIGSDHGLLLQILVARGRIAHGIATEKSASRLRSLRDAWPGTPPSQIEFRHGDGLAAIGAGDRIDTAVLAGMGARTILRILDESPIPLPDHLILQPQTEAESLRRWVRDRDLDLADESIVIERGRPYFLLAVRNRPADPALWKIHGLGDEDLIHAGPLLLRQRSPATRRYWEGQRRRIAALAVGPGGGTKRAELRRIERILAVL